MTPEILADLEKGESLMKAVEAALRRENIDVDELTIATDAKGNVSVFGIARSVEAISRTSEITMGVPGVRRVVNTILPPIQRQP